LLVRDPDTNAFQPAPGFPRTLPPDERWYALVQRCQTEREFRTTVPLPGNETSTYAHVVVVDDACAIIVLGAHPDFDARRLSESLRLLAALVCAEARAEVASGQARAAQDANRRAAALAKALDQSRSELSQKAEALEGALAHAERLNYELQNLNATLEQRVEEEVKERARAENALRQAQKMEAIGQLTGGIAHDFNNLLTIVIGGLDSIDRHLADLPESQSIARIRRFRAMALDGARRAATLTSRLLAFSRRQPLDPKAIDVNRLIVGLADLLQRTLGETVALETVSGGELWQAIADPSQLENAILNLALNARDAMPNGGKLTIETSNAYLDEEYASKLPEFLEPGQYVQIAVCDTGVGMTDDVLQKAFEPFFTTKETGKGTGLGLSQVHGFVRQSGGHVRIYSEVGQGTTVKLYLPRTLQDVMSLDEANLDTVESVRGGAERILVVEDDDSLREFSTRALIELGYRVIYAKSAPRALELIERHSNINLLFTDVVLPDGMNGRQLADEARRRRPELRVLYTTGYTRNAIVHQGRLDPGINFIGKPFTFEQLARRVRAILDS
jgi:signal transduction histidine kinase